MKLRDAEYNVSGDSVNEGCGKCNVNVLKWSKLKTETLPYSELYIPEEAACSWQGWVGTGEVPTHPCHHQQAASSGMYSFEYGNVSVFNLLHCSVFTLHFP